MNSKRRGASFTLVEMLVSIAVFSLLVLLLFSLMSGATKLWRQQTSEEESFREARAALNSLSRDMSVALISANPNWFYCNGTNQIAFLTTLPYIAQNSSVASGDICAVGYSLEWSTNDSSGYQTNMSLYRYVSFSTYSYNNFVLNPSTAGYSVTNVFSTLDPNRVRTLIARDIPQVSFVCYTNDTTGTPWPLTYPVQGIGFPSNMTVNVGFTALNNRTASQLTTQAQWQNTSSAIFQQNEEMFALRLRPQVP